MPPSLGAFPIPKLFPLLLAALLASVPAARAEGAYRAGDVQRANGALRLEQAKAQSAKEKGIGSRFFLTGAGLLLAAGGSAFAYHHDREADRAMTRYGASAFTENTEHLRDKVREHDRLAWAGVAGAALGGILVVVSF
jgi:hypothetical protein